MKKEKVVCETSLCKVVLRRDGTLPLDDRCIRLPGIGIVSPVKIFAKDIYFYLRQGRKTPPACVFIDTCTTFKQKQLETLSLCYFPSLFNLWHSLQ